MIHICAQSGAVQRVHGAGAALEHPKDGRTALLRHPSFWPEDPVPTPAQPPFWLWLQPGWGGGFSSWMGSAAVLAWQCHRCLFDSGGVLGQCRVCAAALWELGVLQGCSLSVSRSRAVSLSPTDGLAAFRAFLRTEFSEENLEFWLACEEFKKIKSQSKMVSKAKKIFAEYIAIQSCKEVRAGCQAGVGLPARWLPGELLTSPGSSAHRSTWTPTHGSTPRRTCRTSPAAASTWPRRGFMGSWRRTRTPASSAPTSTWT